MENSSSMFSFHHSMATHVTIINYAFSKLENLQLTAICRSSLAQEPFINIPVVWVITDDSLGRRLGKYNSAAARGLMSDWRRSFKRADVVVFQDYALPVRIT